MPKKITMSKPSFIKEHVHLVKVLRGGSLSERKREAAEQAKELREKR